MAGVAEKSIAGCGRQAASVTADLGHGCAAAAGRNRQWDAPPGGTGG